MGNIAESSTVAARLILAGVFFLAGAAKLADRKGSSDALSNFGLPPNLAAPLGILLIAAELAVATALASSTTLAWYGACGALALLVIFIVEISANLARGRQPDCRCFGQLHSAPVGWPTLARNGILAACAAWLAAQGQTHLGTSLWARLAALDSQERRIAIVIACVGGFVLFRMVSPREHNAADGGAAETETVRSARSSSQVTPPLHPETTNADAETPEPAAVGPRGIGLPIGTPAPQFNLPDMMGQKHSLRSLLDRGNPVLLIFTNPHCIACQALVPKIGPWTREHKDKLNIVLVSGGSAEENLAKLSDFKSQVLLERNFEVSNAYDSNTTPTAILVGADGTIQSCLAQGRHAIQQFVSSFADLREEKPSS